MSTPSGFTLKSEARLEPDGIAISHEYIARCGEGIPATEQRVERQDDVTRYFKSRPADAAFIATESEPGGWTSATHSAG
jgi:hypothetical protein